MITALSAGFWPGILATALSALVLYFRIISPGWRFAALIPADAVAMIFFVGMGITMSLVAERYRRNLSKLADSKEAELQFFVEYAPAPLAMFDRNMRYLRVSRRHLSDNGLVGRDVTGLSHYEVFPDIPEYFKEAHRRGLAGEVSSSDGDPFVRLDGTVQWKRWEIRPWRDLKGDVAGIILFGEDITERKRTEEQLQKITHTYAVLSEINQAIVRESDASKMLQAVCDIAVNTGGFKLAWIGLLHPALPNVPRTISSGDTNGYLAGDANFLETAARLNGPVGRCIRSGTHSLCNDIEHNSDLGPWKDKALKFGFRSAAALPLKLNGGVIGVFVLYAGKTGFFDDQEMTLLDEMARDISFALEVSQRELARRKFEAELRWRTAFFEAQMESSTDGIMVKDESGEVIFRNHQFRKIWKYPAGPITQTGDSEDLELVLSQVKNPDQLVANTRAIFENPDQVSNDEVELLDGTLLTRFTSPVKDVDGTRYGRIWVFQDITKRRQLEQQLRQSQKMEAVGQLTGGIAHDFNNLLGIILGNLDLLETMLGDNAAALRHLRAAHAASQRGADVTRQLLSFSRSRELIPRPTELQSVFADLMKLTRTLGPDIEFVLQLNQHLPPVLVDISGLENALLNLAVNARDAMPNGGRVTIATDLKTLDETYPLVKIGELKADTYACISVSDTGSGMSKETMERVFEPFFTTKPIGKGTGLGLAMVYGFVRQSGGAIRIYSEPGHGTTVTIYLPLGGSYLIQPDLPAPVSSSIRTSGKVLLVDDEPELLEIAELYLQKMGCHVYRAENPRAALVIAAQESDLALLITDIIMPGGMNGVELARQIREELPQIRVVYCSGYPANAMADRGLPPIDGQLLQKPYKRSEFETAVREAFEGQLTDGIGA
jgi:PAS domain S-box-containing protein